MKTLSIIFIILLFIAPKLAAGVGLLLILCVLCGLLKLNVTYTEHEHESYKEKESDR
jgi:hypothetical protein